MVYFDRLQLPIVKPQHMCLLFSDARRQLFCEQDRIEVNNGMNPASRLV